MKRFPGNNRLALGLLLAMALSFAAPAQARVYVYTGNNAMAKMMLDFLEAMGFIHRLPDRQAAALLSRYRGWGGFPTTSLWGLSPYTGLSSLAAPLAMGSMLAQPGMGGWPGLSHPGNLPWLGATNADRLGSAGGWNGATGVPGQVQMSVEDLQRLLEDRRGEVVADSEAGKEAFASKTSPAASTDVDSLTGLWLGKNRDILTITGNRFIWTDPNGRITKGSFRIVGDRMLVRADGSAALAEYRVQHRGDRLIATNKAGYRYEFTRSTPKRP